MPTRTDVGEFGRDAIKRKRKRKGVMSNRKLTSALMGLSKKVETQPEMKQKDVGIVAQNMGTAPATSTKVFILNNILQGDTRDTREGVKLAVKSVQMRLSFSHDTQQGAAAVDPIRVRYILLKHNFSTDGLPPPSTGIFEFNNGDQADVLSPINNDNTRKFTVLWDNLISVPTGGSVVDKYYRDKGFGITEYLSDSASIPTMNGLYLVARAWTGVLDAGVELSAGIRVRYTDV